MISAKIDSEISNPNDHLTKFNNTRGWRSIFWEARTRLLAWYIILLTCCTVTSVLIVRQILFVNLQNRIEKSLNQEVQEFQQLITGNNPNTGKPFGDDVSAIFKVFLNRNIPDDDEFLITILNGKFYKASPRAMPVPLKPDSELVKYWAQLQEPKQGRKETSEGLLLYRAEPVKIQGQMRGVFVVTQLSAGEKGEVNEAVFVVTAVTLSVLVIASAFAWVAAGKVLAPLRQVTETAQSISETDLEQRIPVVQGTGEIAELTTTFNEMLDRLQFAFTSQRNFINDAGHELRTPITIIRGHLELLGDDPDEQQETLELVMDELDRMSRFVDDLVLLAKAERLDFLQPETVEIAAFTEELLAKAHALGHRDWHIEAIGSGRIVADRQRLTQAMMNLAQNATQHTKEGDVIALGSAIKEPFASFWVRDTGEGIALVDQQRIFERFARLANNHRRSEGAGLGLSIVRAIAQAHGGKVQLNSQLGVGSRFTIIIPLEPPQDVLSHESNSNRRR